MAGLDKIEDLQSNDNNSDNNNKEDIDKVGLVVRREENSNNQGGERDMTPLAGNSIHRSGSRPQLDLSKAAIFGNSEERDPTILLPNQSDDISHLALNIGGIDSHRWNFEASANENAVIKATGGGAYKFADLFKERLEVSIEKEDEIDCLVAGAKFLLKVIRHEAFTHMKGQKEFVQIDQMICFPIFLSILDLVDGDGKFQRISGTNVKGGTYWGLGRLLTKCNSFDELLELSQKGDNRTIDMLVGDIYGGMDYSKIGLYVSTIVSSFSKAISDKKELKDYKPEDIFLSLLRMISYNIGQLVERFPIEAPYTGGKIHGPPLGDLNDKASILL
ncbi:hypothetical protein PTKIN_Ptkin05aG0154300 [Pterospermum kingtungense]